MKTYLITYQMYPEENIKVTVNTKTEEEAVVYAKNYRKEAFTIEEVKGKKTMRYFLISKQDGSEKEVSRKEASEWLANQFSGFTSEEVDDILSTKGSVPSMFRILEVR